MIDWGSVPDWIATIGTVGALVAAVAVLRIEQFVRHSAQISRLFVEYSAAGRASWPSVRSRNARIVRTELYRTSEAETLDAYSVPTGGVSPSKSPSEEEESSSSQETVALYDLIIENASDSPVASCVLHFDVDLLPGRRYYAEEVIVDTESSYVMWEHRRQGWRRRRVLRISLSGGWLLQAL